MEIKDKIMKTLINIKEISSIEVVGEYIDDINYYYIKEDIKFLWWITTKKGWYKRTWIASISNTYFGKDEPNRRSQPYCKIVMNNKLQETYKFDTLKKAEEFADKARKMCNQFGVILIDL